MTTAADLYASWETQQEMYIPAREARYTLMMDLIGQLVAPAAAEAGRPVRVLDLACGPGSASQRVAHAFPGAEIVSIDLDPVLLALAPQAWPADTAQPRWIHADLADLVWESTAGEAGTFDAVISTTALHWLSEAELGATYSAAARLLRSGGVLLNGDYAPGSLTGALGQACGATATLREERAGDAGVLSWDAWWDVVAATGDFGPELAQRTELFGAKERGEAPSRADHLTALQQAGFTQAEVVWQDLDEYLFAAING